MPLSEGIAKRVKMALRAPELSILVCFYELPDNKGARKWHNLHLRQIQKLLHTKIRLGNNFIVEIVENKPKPPVLGKEHNKNDNDRSESSNLQSFPQIQYAS